MTHTRLVLAVLICTVFAWPARAWDAYGHRLITTVALKGMASAKDSPAWLMEPGIARMVADGAVVPDRWRSSNINQLTHVNNPEHYLDIEDLAPYGLTLRTLPTLRYEYVKALALAKEKAGKDFTGRPVNPARDTAKTDELPGFVPYGIVEQYAKVQSAFSVVRMLEKINDPARAHQLELAKQNAMYNMGILAHYVGDAAQPLHMTKHHHGWFGENPHGYTTDRGFHSYIDGRVISLHKIGAADLAPFFNAKATVEARDPWSDVLTYLDATFQTVEPLYKLQKSGDLEKDAGKEFIEQRLAAGATMLSALYRAAWESAAPTDKDIAEFKKYDGRVE